MNSESPEVLLKKSHIQLMRHRKTYLLSGVLMLGESELTDDIPTAATDGVNKYYNPQYIQSLESQPEVNFIVAHEGGHIFLKHMPRHRDLIKEDPRLANMAMDYALNSYLRSIDEPSLLKMPKGALWHPMFENWSVRQIYNYLKTGQDNEGNKKGEPRTGKNPRGEEIIVVGDNVFRTQTLDEHDASGMDGMTDEQVEEVNKRIDQAIQQAALMAGINGAEVPRVLTELLQPVIDWREVFTEFLTEWTRGIEEFSFAKFNRKRLELFRPSTYSEKVGRVVVAIDTSGSITQDIVTTLCTELAGICEQCAPEEVHVLWWDTDVKGHQVFSDGGYQNLSNVLKPVGGGGTRVGCVSDYLRANHIDSDCVVVFTDGYVEDKPQWAVDAPTLWLVTANDRFIPPSGQVVKFN